MELTLTRRWIEHKQSEQDNFKPTCQVCEAPAKRKHVSGKILCDKCFENENNQSTEKPKPIEILPVTNMTQPGLK